MAESTSPPQPDNRKKSAKTAGKNEKFVERKTVHDIESQHGDAQGSRNSNRRLKKGQNQQQDGPGTNANLNKFANKNNPSNNAKKQSGKKGRSRQRGLDANTPDQTNNSTAGPSVNNNNSNNNRSNRKKTNTNPNESNLSTELKSAAPNASSKAKKKRKKKQNANKAQNQSEDAKKKAAALQAAKEEIAREKAKQAAEKAALAEAKARYEAEQARIIDEKENRLKAFKDACDICSTLAEQSIAKQKSRSVLLSPDKLSELRSNHQQLKKSLKSDVKKCTAFCRKIKMGGWDSPASNNSTDFAIVKDIKTLNLSRYVEEVASAVMEVKFKMTDLPVVVALCTAMHERYEDFLPALMPKLISFLKAKDNSSLQSQQQQANAQYHQNGEGEESGVTGGITSAALDRAKEAIRQRRMCLKLLVEFIMNGVVGDSKLLIKIIAEATGAPSSTSASINSAQQHQAYAVTDANVIISFAKAAGHELLGNPSRTVRNAKTLWENETKLLLQSEEDLLAQRIEEKTKPPIESIADHPSLETKTDDPGAINESKKTSDIPTNHQDTQRSATDEPQPNPKILELDEELILLAKNSSAIPIGSSLELRAISQPHSMILRKHCNGAFEFFCKSYIATHGKLQKLQTRCEQDRLLVGSLSEAREKGLIEAKKMLETLRNRVELLAEILDENVPSVGEEDADAGEKGTGTGSGENGEGVGLELWMKGQNDDGEGGGHANLGPFDDEDARSFYCDLPDFLTTIPPALLGLTQADVDRISAENAQKYGGIIDEDETVVEEIGESSGQTIEHPDEGLETKKIVDEVAAVGEDNTDDTDISKDDNDESSDKDKDTPHYKLTVLIDQELPECNRRESTDILAEKFCNNHGASKSSRKRLSKALFLVPRTRLDLLPYYSRVAATLQRVYPVDIGPSLIEELEAQFHGLARWKKNQNLEGRIKNARFIGELTKFRVAPPIVSLKCLKRCLDDFTGYNIDIACCLLESCGKYLYRLKHTNGRVTKVMDTMMRIRKAKHLDDRAIALIDSAFFMVTPPSNPVRKQAKTLPPLELYLKHLFMIRLVPESDVISFVSKQLQRLPWSEPSIDCGTTTCKYMLKACRKGRYKAVKAVAEVAAALRRARPEISSRLIDAVLEELQSFLENPSFRDQQRVLVMSRLLGELYNAALVPTSLIFDQLHHFINFGHDVPEALREASEKQQEDRDTTSPSCGVTASSSRSLLSHRRDVTQVIPEDEELEETDEESADIQEPSEQTSVVVVSQHSQFDPRIISHIDTPNSVSRIKLVCTLLESVGSNIVVTNNLSKLHHFLASLQRYLFTKPTLPTEVEFCILDLFDSYDSYLKLVDKNDSKSTQSNKVIPKGFVRYSNWYDAHRATIAAEEAEAIAEAKAKARLLAVGGADDTAITTIDEDDKEELDNSDIISEEDLDVDDESAASVNSEESVESVGGSVDDSEESESEDETVEESDSGSETGESDEETDDSDDEMYIDDEDEEEEIDEAVAQEMYMRQLEEEAFERELRKITMDAIEKGKVAARTGNGSKIADNMVHASHFVVKKNDGAAVINRDEPNAAKTALGGEEGVNFKLLKRGHKGRVEAKHFVVPTETNLARQATKQDDEAAREREALKARVLQYEVESAEQQYSGNVYMDQTKLQVIRNRPLSMEDIDRNFGNASEEYSYSSSSGRWSNSVSGRHRSTHHSGGRGGGRGRGGRSLRFY